MAATASETVHEELQALDLTDFFDWGEFEQNVNETNVEDAEEILPVCDCKIPSTENLVKCKNPSCNTQWFHSTCVMDKPVSEYDEDTLENWICTTCSDAAGSGSQPAEKKLPGKNVEKTGSSSRQKSEKMKYPSATYKKADATVVAPDFLAAAVEDIFENELFSLETPLAKAVRELAVRVKALLGTMDFNRFAANTVDSLWKMVKKMQGSTWTDKLKGEMWHQFHVYRSSNETLKRWQHTLSGAKIPRKAEEEVFFLQHLLQKIFLSLLATLLETDMPAEVLDDVCPQDMDESEEQALRYCAGYVPFKLRKRYVKMKDNDVATQYAEILSSWSVSQNDDADSLLAYTTKWIDEQSRGGLFKINDDVFILFKLMEGIVRATVQVKNINCLQDVNLQSLLLKKMEGNQKLLSSWNSVCLNLAQEGSSKLRTEVFKCFIKMRCESFIKVYLHIRKQNYEKVSKKMEKGLRKELSKEKK